MSAELQRNTEALMKGLTSQSEDLEGLRKQIQDLHSTLTPENLTDQGSRKRLEVLHAQIINRAEVLGKISSNQRTNVQQQTLDALNGLSTSLAQNHGIIERRFDNDILHNVATTRILPYHWLRRAGMNETWAGMISGATVLGAAYLAWNAVVGTGRRAYRGVRRATSGIFGTVAKLAAGAAAIVGLQRWNPSWLPEFLRASPTAPLTPEQIKKQDEEKKLKEEVEQRRKLGEQTNKSFQEWESNQTKPNRESMMKAIQQERAALQSVNTQREVQMRLQYLQTIENQAITPLDIMAGEQQLTLNGVNYRLRAEANGVLTVNGHRWQLEGTGLASAATFTISRARIRGNFVEASIRGVLPNPTAALFGPPNIVDTTKHPVFDPDRLQEILNHLNTQNTPYSLPSTLTNGHTLQMRRL